MANIASYILAHFYFYMVKSSAEHAIDFGLRDESVLVDRLDYAENCNAFNLAAHYHEHGYFVLGIPTHALKHGAASMRISDDRIGNLFPFVGEYHELHSLPVGVYYHIGNY